MTRFNPFPHLSGAYGAPMGRHGDSPEQFDPSARLYARPAGGDGYYDRGGAYWGRSPREGGVWAVWTRGGAQCGIVMR